MGSGLVLWWGKYLNHGKIERIDTVKHYNDYAGVDTLHPLVSEVDFSELSSIRNFRQYMGFMPYS